MIRRTLGKLLRSYLASQHRVIVSYQTKERIKIFKHIEEVIKEGMVTGIPEAFQIIYSVMQTRKIGGDIAEVGTYKGGSAKLICENKRSFHLYI